MLKWKIDPDHVVGEFTVKHMMVTSIHGQFNKVTGMINFDPTDPASTSVEVEVDVASIYTGIDRRDNHLRSADFFDVDNFPKMYFKSTGIGVVGLNHCKVTGDLTLHGITQSVTFDVSFVGPSRFFDDEETKMYTAFGFRATACINREDFGMKWNLDIEDGGFMVGKHVDIIFNTEADLVSE
jgi:polyisoprenoid-binding protein YceI